jgi:hypothetical protein
MDSRWWWVNESCLTTSEIYISSFIEGRNVEHVPNSTLHPQVLYQLGLPSVQILVHLLYGLSHRGSTGGPRATSGPRPLIARPAKLFVNLLLVTTSSFIFFPRIWKKSWFLSLLLLYVQVPHMLLTLKPKSKMQVFQIQIVSNTSCCRSKFNIIYNSIVTCAHFN